MICNSGVPCPDFISARGACSASCQLRFTSPTQTRNRQCVGATFNDNCNGAVLTDTQNCNVQVYCPGIMVHGVHGVVALNHVSLITLGGGCAVSQTMAYNSGVLCPVSSNRFFV
ncbi:uncharacterized protein LOC136076692 isoform X2 [Hydra vulgaris]|uniref:Uncharacterized protein LOC136076692 isoform X2 n=1 Tax=Hydra vulgaris TaxID=6087 RepID=A0ABM4BB29_HYDVU